MTISAILALVMMIILTTTGSAAQDRITFRRGASSATVSGRIEATHGVGSSHYRHYVLRANAGQTITATVSSGNRRVYFAENDETTYRIKTDSAGDYTISIYNTGVKGTNFSMTVSIR